jgi:hypothetical protein
VSEKIARNFGDGGVNGNSCFTGTPHHREMAAREAVYSAPMATGLGSLILKLERYDNELPEAPRLL